MIHIFPGLSRVTECDERTGTLSGRVVDRCWYVTPAFVSRGKVHIVPDWLLIDHVKDSESVSFARSKQAAKPLAEVGIKVGGYRLEPALGGKLVWVEDP